jgi:hypothetical protein
MKGSRLRCLATNLTAAVGRASPCGFGPGDCLSRICRSAAGEVVTVAVARWPVKPTTGPSGGSGGDGSREMGCMSAR